MDILSQDLRFALRSLGRRPWFAAAVIGMLALGIGFNAAIFSIVDAVLLRPLPLPAPERIVVVWGKHPQIGRETASLPDYLDWKSQNTVFSGMTAFANSRMTLSLPGGEPERLPSALVSSDYFRVLGVGASLGRTFRDEDGVFGNHRVVVLSHGLWTERLGADTGVLGRAVSMNGTTYTVIGVAPPDFRVPEDVRLWAPYAPDPALAAPSRRSDFLHVLARLGDGVTIDRAQREMTTITTRLAEQYPATNRNWSSELVELREQMVSGARTALLAFMGAVGLVLLIVCANVANLLLARAATRDREMAVRASLGASRGRLFRQTLVESVVLALLGGGFGILLAFWGVSLVTNLLPPEMPRLGEIAVSGRVLGFALLASLGTGIAFGLAPALRLSAGALSASMNDGGRGGIGTRAATRLRGALVLAQVALALVNLLGCGLLVRSFLRLQQVDLGFAAPRVLAFQVPLPREKYVQMERATQFFDELTPRLAALRGVERVGLTSDLPLAGGYQFGAFEIDGKPQSDPNLVQDAVFIVADSGYFTALAIPLQQGRMFSRDDHARAPRVGLVSGAFARRYFGTESPVGRRVRFGDGPDSWITIAGVVGDTRQETMAGQAHPAFYAPATQQPQRGYVVVMRVAGDPLGVLAAVRREVRALEPGAPLADVATMEDRVAKSLAQPRLTLVLAAVFSVLAMFLALTGIYAVVAYAVAQRTRELGIRMALGASARDVLRMVVREGMTPALLGLAVGVVLAFGVARALSALLYGVAATDPLTFITVPLVLAVAALVACYFPARAATRVDPVTALRQD